MKVNQSRKRLWIAGLAVAFAVAASTALNAVAQERDEKRAIEEQQKIAIANAPRAEKSDPAQLRPSSSPDPEWPTGIFETGQAPFSSSYARVVNQWQGVIDGAYVQVFAGALTSIPENGALIVVRTSFTNSPLGHQVYPAPGARGPLRLTSATGAVLEATSSMGESFSFDLRAGRYDRR